MCRAATYIISWDRSIKYSCATAYGTVITYT